MCRNNNSFGCGLCPGTRLRTLARSQLIGLLWLGIAAYGCEQEGSPRWPEGCGGDVTALASSTAPEPACREAWTGEIVINEVVHRPAGRDVDGDGKSNSRDELLEVLSVADEPVHLRGAELHFAGSNRGAIAASDCLPPLTVAIIVGSTTGLFVLPEGAQRLALDHTLRLTDGGGELTLVGVSGTNLGSVLLPPADDASGGCVCRQVEGERGSAMVPHAQLERARGAGWSPGLCAGGGRFPACLNNEAGLTRAAAEQRQPPRGHADAMGTSGG